MIVKCLLADLNIRIDVENDETAAFFDRFRYDFRCEPDALIFVTQEDIKEVRALITGISAEDAAKALVLRWLGDKLAAFGNIVVLGEKTKSSLKIGGENASVYILSENGELFSTPWSESDPSRLTINEIHAQGMTENTEKAWLNFMFLNTKAPKSQDNFGKYLSTLGKLYRNFKIKNGI